MIYANACLSVSQSVTVSVFLFDHKVHKIQKKRYELKLNAHDKKQQEKLIKKKHHGDDMKRFEILLFGKKLNLDVSSQNEIRNKNLLINIYHE